MKSGIWRAEMFVQDGHQLPFNFLLEKGESGYRMEVYNAEEVLLIDEILLEGDSLIIRMPVFEGYFAGTFSEEYMEGEFIKDDLGRRVPFRATFGDTERFRAGEPPSVGVGGVWETYFSKGTDDEYEAKGIFSQDGDRVTGTFRTTTGDYRYLEGSVQGDSLKLSTFDGAHVFLFLAQVSDSTLNGVFYSGNHFREPFEGQRNDTYELPDEDSLTFLKEGYEEIDFSFLEVSGNRISPADPIYRDKVLILQIMGTWCPNCLDETKFLVEYLGEHQTDGLEVIALAFEYARTEEAAFRRITRLKERLDIPYPVVLAQYGTSDKATANEKLPMLNHILSYPTTIFIDKKGQVRRIHTGFNGPATGEKYSVFKKEFDDFVQELLSE
jgi:thiol-disulfide isomerase/thioredoxin